jgi:hypothetical protein
MDCFPGCCAKLLCRIVNLFVTQFTSEVASTVFGWNGGSLLQCIYRSVPPSTFPPTFPSSQAGYNNGERLRMLWDGLIDASRQSSSSSCPYLCVILEGYTRYQGRQKRNVKENIRSGKEIGDQG